MHLPVLRGCPSLKAAAEIVQKEASRILDLILETAVERLAAVVTLKTNCILPICKSISARNFHVLKKAH